MTTWGTVLGGTGRPQFLLCGDELVQNRSFESNIYGWSNSPADVLTRGTDTTTFFGDYVATISDVGAQVSRSRGIYSCTVGSSLSGMTFALSFYAKATVGHTCTARIRAVDEILTSVDKVLPAGEWTHYLEQFTFSTSNRGTFSIDIFAVAGGSYSGSILLDQVSCRQVNYDLYDEFPYCPNIDEPDWDINILSSGRLIDGSLKEFSRGWEPKIRYTYDYFDQTQEYYRQIMSESDFIWLKPHYDYEYWVAVKWSGQYRQRYFGNVHAGHVGTMEFVAMFLLENKPFSVS